MRVRFVFDKKAQDAPISLSGVTFDTARFDEVVKAFRTLGPDDKVAKMVKLTSRTNKVMTFNITGDENQLKKFFEQFYVHMTWDEIKSKYRPGAKQNQKEEGKHPMIAELERYLLNQKIKDVKISLDINKKELVFETYPDALRNLLVVELIQGNYKKSNLYKLLRKHHFDFESIDKNKILLKSI